MKKASEAVHAFFREYTELSEPSREMLLQKENVGGAEGGIGTYKEKELHRLLKRFFEPDPGFREVPVDGYIADIKNRSGITEIQTVSLSGIKEKLADFLCENRVRVVFPLETVRHIVWVSPSDGSVSKRNRSPKPDNKYRLLAELIYILDCIGNPNLTVTAVHLAVDEYRLLDGWSRDGKRGSTKLERIPTDIFGISDFSSVEDYAELVPDDIASPFTREEFSKCTGLRGRRLWAGIRVLESMNLISRTASPDRKYRYAITEQYSRFKECLRDIKKREDFS